MWTTRSEFCLHTHTHRNPQHLNVKAILMDSCCSWGMSILETQIELHSKSDFATMSGSRDPVCVAWTHTNTWTHRNTYLKGLFKIWCSCCMGIQGGTCFMFLVSIANTVEMMNNRNAQVPGKNKTCFRGKLLLLSCRVCIGRTLLSCESVQVSRRPFPQSEHEFFNSL